MASDRALTPKGQATRERILDAATELIATHGVSGVSNDQVRAAAGISGSQLYHYFDSKQALVRAVITRQAEAGAGSGGLPLLGPLDSLEALRAWADAAVAHQAETGGRGECTLTGLAAELAPADELSRREISTGFLRWKDLLRDGLAAMRQRGELRPDADVDELAHALLAALQGGALLSQTLRDVAPMRAALNAALSYAAGHTVG